MNYTKLLAFTTLLLLGLLLVACAEEAAAPTIESPTAAAAPTQETAATTAPEEEAPAAAPTAESAADEDATPTEETAAAEEPLYLAIIWHQHQPVYYKDPATNVYVRPWVRVHATKDYVDMAAMLAQYPDIHATFNLTPSLIRQLDDLAAGAKDLYWVTAEVPAEELTTEQKQFLLDRFFDTNREIIGRFPRYLELLEKRDGSDDPLTAFTTEDYRDLQILFNLAWVDPEWLAQEPLAALVAKGEGFSEADKEVLFAEHLRLIQEVIPVHAALQDTGQIEVTMTPFAHPILPLLVDTNLARVALPDVELPAQRFVYGQDAVAQVERGVELYESHFGRPPRGMWPAEGSVAQEIVTMVAQNGIQWMASDEGVLANSLGLDNFTRDSGETVVEADELYRPYYVQGSRGGPVAIVFRDVVLSDKVGFTYSGLDGAAAAQDFVDRLHAIRTQLQESGAEGPHLVSVILDGENAWEFYENDGKEFLNTLYQTLSDDPLIETVTPSEFLAIAPEQPQIDELWAGSWINHDFATWIGEEEENRAWDYLAQTREFLQQYITGSRQGDVSPEALEEALTQMYIAEGSDWFWWYGSDQNSGNDDSFDAQFRATLAAVYEALGAEPPAFVSVPIIPEAAATADRPATDLITPTIDGAAAAGEWDAAGRYAASGGVMAAAERYFDAIDFGFDSRNLYLHVTRNPDYTPPAGASSVDFYLGTPGSATTSNFSRGGSLLGFPANQLLSLSFADGALAEAAAYTAEANGKWTAAVAAPAADGQVALPFGEEASGQIAASGSDIEIAIPLAALGGVDVGSQLSMRAYYQEPVGEALVDGDRIPGPGPAVVAVPDLGTTTVILDVADPEGDDYGPGAYTYPTDAVFNAGNFDVTNFQVGYDENNVVFRFAVRGPVDNVWDSPNGLSLQTFDVYIDSDGAAAGDAALLPGRNLAFAEDYRWDYAITVEGWTPGVYVPGAEGPQRIAEASEFVVLTDPGQRRVTIRVPKAILGDNPEAWCYAAVVMSQEGFPSSGVLRVRDVAPTAEQWRIGGAPAGATNHTRVIDFVWPEPGQQEAWLSDFTPSDAMQSDLTAADFATVPMLEAQP